MVSDIKTSSTYVYKLMLNLFLKGLTWNEKTNKFYYIDSAVYDIKEFDYDPKTKNICKLTFIC